MNNKNKMMRRLLSAAACAALMGAANVHAADTADILEEMETANDADIIIEKYGKAAYQETFYYSDDTIRSEYHYKDASLYALENEDMVLIDENGEVYGYDNDNAAAFRYLFADGAYDEFLMSKTNKYLSGYQYDSASESLVSQEEQGGILYVATEITDEDLTKQFAETMGYEADSVVKDSYIYQLDPDTLEIQKMTHTLQLTGGTEKVLEEMVWVEEPEDYVPEEQLKETVFAEEDIRTVTITLDPGTEQEETYTQTIAKGNIVRVRLPADYDQTLYLDADCTEACTGGADTSEDLSLYAKSQAD